MKQYMKRALSLVLIGVLLLALSLSVLAADEINAISEEGAAQNGMRLDCRSAILMDAKTGQVLFEQNPDEALPPASVTKIMTLLLVMEAVDSGKIALSDMVTVSANAASMGGSQVFLK